MDLYASAQSSARAVYFSSVNGDDARSSSSLSAPWKSLTKLHQLDYSKIDTIFLERGSTWNAVKLRLKNVGTREKPLVFAAYGNGKTPAIYGSKIINGGFSNEGNNLWKVVDGDLPAFIPKMRTAIAGVFVNGKYYEDSRYPDEGFLEISSFQGKTQVTDSKMNWANDQWKGAYVNLRAQSWTWSLFRVGSNNTNTLFAAAGDELDDQPNYDSYHKVVNGRYYIIRNHKNACNRDGEWAHDGNTLWVKWPSDLNKQKVEAIVVDTILSFVDSHVKLHNLTIDRANMINISAYRTDLALSGCNVSYSGSLWICAKDDSGQPRNPIIDVRNSSFRKSNHAGIYTQLMRGKIEHNSFTNNTVGIDVRNLRGKGYQSVSSVHITRNTGPMHVSYNRFDSVNIALQTHWAMADWWFENNLITNYALTVGDIGATYCGGDWGNYNKNIRYNIIVNPATTGKSTYGGGFSSLPFGIYYDYSTGYVKAEYNTLVNPNRAAYFHSCGQGLKFNHNNVLNGAGVHNYPWNQAILLDDLSNEWGEGRDIENVEIMHNNIVFGQSNVQNENAIHWLIRPSKEYTIQTNRVNYNNYFTPYSKGTSLTLHSTTYGNQVHKSFGWKNHDINSTINKNGWTYEKVKDMVAPDEFVKVFYNWSDQPKKLCLPDVYLDVNGNKVSGEITIPPFFSELLFYHSPGGGCSIDPDQPDSSLIEEFIFTVNINEQTTTNIGYVNLEGISDNTPVRYEIIEGNEDNLFQINPYTGQIYLQTIVIEPLVGSTHNLVVGAFINGESSSEKSANVKVDFIGDISQASGLVGDLDFEVYPNPSSGIVYVKGFTQASVDARINVFDMGGRLLHTEQMYDAGSVHELDFSPIGKGFYILTIEAGERVSRKRLVIQ